MNQNTGYFCTCCFMSRHMTWICVLVTLLTFIHQTTIFVSSSERREAQFCFPDLREKKKQKYFYLDVHKNRYTEDKTIIF